MPRQRRRRRWALHARRRHRAPAALQALHLLLRRGQRRGLLRPLLALVLPLLGVVVLARAVL